MTANDESEPRSLLDDMEVHAAIARMVADANPDLPAESLTAITSEAVDRARATVNREPHGGASSGTAPKLQSHVIVMHAPLFDEKRTASVLEYWHRQLIQGYGGSLLGLPTDVNPHMLREWDRADEVQFMAGAHLSGSGAIGQALLYRDRNYVGLFVVIEGDFRPEQWGQSPQSQNATIIEVWVWPALARADTQWPWPDTAAAHHLGGGFLESAEIEYDPLLRPRWILTDQGVLLGEMEPGRRLLLVAGERWQIRDLITPGNQLPFVVELDRVTRRANEHVRLLRGWEREVGELWRDISDLSDKASNELSSRGTRQYLVKDFVLRGDRSRNADRTELASFREQLRLASRVVGAAADDMEAAAARFELACDNVGVPRDTFPVIGVRRTVDTSLDRTRRLRRQLAEMTGQLAEMTGQIDASRAYDLEHRRLVLGGTAAGLLAAIFLVLLGTQMFGLSVDLPSRGVLPAIFTLAGGAGLFASQLARQISHGRNLRVFRFVNLFIGSLFVASMAWLIVTLSNGSPASRWATLLSAFGAALSYAMINLLSGWWLRLERLKKRQAQQKVATGAAKD
jgi:hypothetical protein